MQIKKVMLAVGVASIFMAAQSAFAISGVNDTTGPDSTNLNTWNISAPFTNLSVENTATINENPNITVDTGNNTVSPNTVVGDVSTGDVIGELSFSHVLNNGVIDLGSVIPSLSLNLRNHITGPNSTNLNTVNVNSGCENSDPTITNKATFTGNYTLDANTGMNSIDSNTKVGDISTGDVKASIASNVTLNKHAGNIVIPAMPSITGTFENSITGPGSDNENTLNLNPSSQATVINNISKVTDNIDATINTGNNTVSNNTVVGNVKTGSVNFNVNVSTSAN